MKKLLCAIGMAMLAIAAGPRWGFADRLIYNADLVNDTVAVDTNYDLDLKEIDTISMVASYSTAAISNVSFDTGRVSTMSITVPDYDNLIAQPATLQITVSSGGAALAGAVVTLNGVRFKEGAGGNWTRNASTVTSASSLASAIDAHADFHAASANNVVYATATTNGLTQNSWAATVSTVALTLSGSTFSGGQNNARLAVNGVVFDQGTGFTAATSNAATAQSISDALMANSTLAALFTSTWSAAGVVTATAAAVGQNAYTLFTSTPAKLNLNGSTSNATDTFLNGLDSDVNLTNDTIDITNHGLKTGFAVLFSTVSGSTPPTGLTNQTTYYPIIVTKSQIKLASSKANAVAGTAVNLTAQTTGNSFTLAPIGISGNPSFKWQGGNNSSTFIDLAVSSVTITGTSSTSWDFGTLPYRYLRLKYTAPTFGGATMQVTGSGRGE